MNNTTSREDHHALHIPGLRIFIAILFLTVYLFGYIGCILSIITFSSKNLRRHSTGFLFLVMAFVDIFSLVASLQYFLDVVQEIKVLKISIGWCRFFTIFNYEIYFGFSWIFVFISVDRWIKVEWPTKSQTLCTRKRFIYLCSLALILSLTKNLIYTFVCFNNDCENKNVFCEIFIHTIYILIYMVIPITVILISISRTCLITLHVKRRFRTPNQQQPSNVVSKPLKLDTVVQCTSTTDDNLNSTTITNRTPNLPAIIDHRRRSRRRGSRLDTQMIILISINVVPFILVHIITEVAYLFEIYSKFVRESNTIQLVIVMIYLSWYLISATRFYTNCLLSRIYREEFLNRLHMLRHGCKSPLTIVDQVPSRRPSTRYFTGVENTFIPIQYGKSLTVT